VYGPGRDTRTASTIGFTLNMAGEHHPCCLQSTSSYILLVFFSRQTMAMVRVFNMLETEANSLERVQSYLEIEKEPEPQESGVPPAYWPASGALRAEGLTARYSSDGPVVLDHLSFDIKAGERIGIVGRTGSGKSTLTLALLRCIFTEGEVYYDGLPTSALNLDALRRNVTIIPQAPELLSGTLRMNLDLFGQHEDAELNDALRAAGLFALQAGADESRLALDSQISAGGGNLSVGQRQIIAMARAVVRQSKLLILDEATSAIDHETDAAIQASLRTALKSDVTVLCVAHRLQSVVDADRIVSRYCNACGIGLTITQMVLDAGKLVEFDSPKSLLEQEGSFFRALVDESADKDTLYSMINSAS
jgi:ABC-type multidrug transport system fused ATPase/permease subunit